MKYPKRPSHFAHKFCRQLTKSAAAQAIGPEACWLLTIIAHQEDAKRYRGAVTFYNCQLLPLCGFNTEDRLSRVRKKAIEANWLHYEPGRKGVPGRYWCLNPLEQDGLSDGPIDESDATKRDDEDCEFVSPKTRGKPENFPPSNSGVQALDKPRTSAGLSTLTLKPFPKDQKSGSHEPDTQKHSKEALKWSPRFSTGEFLNLNRGHARFEEALEAGVVREGDRLRFLTLWHHCGRQFSDDKIKRPGGLFLKLMRSNEWQGSQADEDAVHKFIGDKTPKTFDDRNLEFNQACDSLAVDSTMLAGVCDD